MYMCTCAEKPVIYVCMGNLGVREAIAININSAFAQSCTNLGAHISIVQQTELHHDDWE